MREGPLREQSPSFDELHKRAEEQLEYWVQGAVLEFTQELSDILERDDISRTEFAKRAGVSQAYVTKVLSGEGNFTLATMSKLAHAVGVQLRLHLAPPNTVTKVRDLPLPFARAIKWEPVGRIRVESGISARRRIDRKGWPLRQVKTSGSEGHDCLPLTA